MVDGLGGLSLVTPYDRQVAVSILGKIKGGSLLLRDTDMYWKYKKYRSMLYDADKQLLNDTYFKSKLENMWQREQVSSNIFLSDTSEALFDNTIYAMANTNERLAFLQDVAFDDYSIRLISGDFFMSSGAVSSEKMHVPNFEFGKTWAVTRDGFKHEVAISCKRTRNGDWSISRSY